MDSHDLGQRERAYTVFRTKVTFIQGGMNPVYLKLMSKMSSMFLVWKASGSNGKAPHSLVMILSI